MNFYLSNHNIVISILSKYKLYAFDCCNPKHRLETKINNFLGKNHRKKRSAAHTQELFNEVIIENVSILGIAVFASLAVD